MIPRCFAYLLIIQASTLLAMSHTRYYSYAELVNAGYDHNDAKRAELCAQNTRNKLWERWEYGERLSRLLELPEFRFEVTPEVYLYMHCLPDEEGDTPLQTLIQQFSVIQSLQQYLELQDDIEWLINLVPQSIFYANKKKYTPMHGICSREVNNNWILTRILKLMLSKNTHAINMKTCEGYTPLHFACMKPELHGMALALLQAGANPNVQTAQSEVARFCHITADTKHSKLMICTPLFLAYRYECTKTASHLLAHGANPFTQLIHRQLVQRSSKEILHVAIDGLEATCQQLEKLKERCDRVTSSDLLDDSRTFWEVPFLKELIEQLEPMHAQVFHGYKLHTLKSGQIIIFIKQYLKDTTMLSLFAAQLSRSEKAPESEPQGYTKILVSPREWQAFLDGI